MFLSLQLRLVVHCFLPYETEILSKQKKHFYLQRPTKRNQEGSIEVILLSQISKPLSPKMWKFVLKVCRASIGHYGNAMSCWIIRDPGNFIISCMALRLKIRSTSDSKLPERRIGRSSPIKYPAKSPDRTPSPFFMWLHLGLCECLCLFCSDTFSILWERKD